MSLLDTRPSNPRRPVDWRWQRAGYVQNTQFARLFPADAQLTRCTKMRQAVERCQDEAALFILSAYYPHEYEAWKLYNGETFEIRRSRWELEARLLAREHLRDIGRKLNLTPMTISIYQDWFFDIKRIIDSPSILTHMVFTVPAANDDAHIDAACMWRLTGYWGGPQVLDNITHQLCDNQSSQLAATFYDEQFRVALARKAYTTMLNMKVNSFNATEVISLFLQMRTMEKNEDRAAMGEKAVVDTLKSFFEHLPWDRAYGYQKQNKDLALIDNRAAGLRDTELANTTALGTLPPEYAAILDSVEEVPFGETAEDRTHDA